MSSQDTFDIHLNDNEIPQSLIQILGDVTGHKDRVKASKIPSNKINLEV